MTHLERRLSVLFVLAMVYGLLVTVALFDAAKATQ